MGSSFLTIDEALSLWSGSIDSKTQEYQGTNHRGYQIVRTHTKETTWIQDRHHPNTSSTPCRTPHLNNKQNKNTNPIISRQKYHLTQPCPSEEKANKNSARISPYKKLTQTTGPTLEGRNKKEERIQPLSLKHNRLEKEIMKRQRNTTKWRNNLETQKSK